MTAFRFNFHQKRAFSSDSVAEPAGSYGMIREWPGRKEFTAWMLHLIYSKSGKLITRVTG